MFRRLIAFVIPLVMALAPFGGGGQVAAPLAASLASADTVTTWQIPNTPLKAGQAQSLTEMLAAGYTHAEFGGILSCPSWGSYNGTMEVIGESSTDGGATWVQEFDDVWPGGFLSHSGGMPGAFVDYMDGVPRVIRFTIVVSKNLTAGATMSLSTTP